MRLLVPAAALAVLSLPAFGPLGCGPAPATLPDRQPGERAPLSGNCDPTDATRCALPWPSNTFTVRDESTATGLRLALDRRTLPAGDEVGFLERADGFSRMSPLLTAFPGTLDPASLEGSMRLLVAQPGAPDEGAQVPLRITFVPSQSELHGTESLLLGFPLRPLAPAADHVVVVMDSLRSVDGGTFTADHLTRLALGLDAPGDDDERRRAAYHAPTRALLERAQLDPAHVLRVWDFTTRSQRDPRFRLEAMRDQALAAVRARQVGVALDAVTLPATGSVLAVVEGRLTSVPSFRTEDGMLRLDEAGLPAAEGVHDAPFRVMIPRGQGDYRLVLYGHGTGGSIHDDTFDESIAASGLGKAAGLFYGWEDTAIFGTLMGLGHVQHGTAQSTAGLMQALADFSALEEALIGVLADSLSAPMLKGQPNPAEGRRPDAREPLWTGGSLGGTLGFVYAGLSPRVRFAVLNVPGAGWTHFIPGSSLFTTLAPSLQANYSSPLDFWLTLMVSQLAWDDVDGGNWADDLSADGSAYLVQESMGDPVLPNPGSELCAAAVGARQVGAVLRAIPGVAPAPEADGASGLTQFEVPAGVEGFSRHGFAARDTPAGVAAREQITGFIRSALAGTPKISVPTLCQTNTVQGSCDFSAAP